MQPEHGIPTLVEAMDEISEAAQSFALTEDGMTSPILHCFSDEGALTIAHLVGQRGPHLGRAVQHAIAALDPLIVILAAQAWVTMVKRDEVPIPHHKRPHVLMLMGEDRAGHELNRAWYIIEPAGRGDPRTLLPMDMEGATSLGGNVHPLFLFRQYVKAGYNEKVARAMARKEAEAAGGINAVPLFTSGLRQ
jgi:hypothetical protein